MTPQNTMARSTGKFILTIFLSAAVGIIFEDGLRLFFSFAISKVQLVSSSLYDSYFEDMSSGVLDYDFYMFYIIAAGIMISCCMIIFSDNDEPKANLSEEDDIDMLSKEDLVDRYAKLIMKVAESDRAIKKSEIIIKASKIVIVVSTLIVFFVWGLSAFKIGTIRNFERQVKILTPYINEHDKDLLISDFARMKTAKDYDKIQSRVAHLFDSVGQTMPKDLKQ